MIILQFFICGNLNSFETLISSSEAIKIIQNYILKLSQIYSKFHLLKNINYHLNACNEAKILLKNASSQSRLYSQKKKEN